MFDILSIYAEYPCLVDCFLFKTSVLCKIGEQGLIAFKFWFSQLFYMFCYKVLSLAFAGCKLWYLYLMSW